MNSPQEALICRDHFVYAPYQWEMALHFNTVSHWLGAYTELSLDMYVHFILFVLIEIHVWANGDPALCHKIASLGYHELLSIAWIVADGHFWWFALSASKLINNYKKKQAQ